MYVCLCQAITEESIRQLLVSGKARTLDDLKQQLSIAVQCGSCLEQAQLLVEEHHALEDSDTRP